MKDMVNKSLPPEVKIEFRLNFYHLMAIINSMSFMKIKYLENIGFITPQEMFLKTNL